MRIDEEEELLAELAVVAGGAEPAVSRVAQDSLHPDAAGDLAVRVPALAGVDQTLDCLLNGGVLTSLRDKITATITMYNVHIQHAQHVHTCM